MIRNVSFTGSSRAQASAVWVPGTCNFLSTESVKDLNSLSEFTHNPQQMKSARDDINEIFPALSPSVCNQFCSTFSNFK